MHDKRARAVIAASFHYFRSHLEADIYSNIFAHGTLNHQMIRRMRRDLTFPPIRGHVACIIAWYGGNSVTHVYSQLLTVASKREHCKRKWQVTPMTPAMKKNAGRCVLGYQFEPKRARESTSVLPSPTVGPSPASPSLISRYGLQCTRESRLHGGNTSMLLGDRQHINSKRQGRPSN